MSALGSIPLTSLKTLAVVVVLARAAPARCPGRTRRWLGRTVILLVPTILIASAGALVFNRSLGLVKTSGDLTKLVFSTVFGTTAQSGGEADVEAQSAAASALDATFTKTEDGMLETTWT
ncbi:MAG: esterase, partial [Thermobifida sp.]|nr:esterase [Thermobifida sp.]